LGELGRLNELDPKLGRQTWTKVDGWAELLLPYHNDAEASAKVSRPVKAGPAGPAMAGSSTAAPSAGAYA
jgi:hypothetical protein